VTTLSGRPYFFMMRPFMLHLYAALAEKERAMTSARTKAALAAAKAKGTQLGNPRLEEVRGRAVESTKAATDRFAANVLPVILPIKAEGASLRQIADVLNTRGIAARSGREMGRDPGRRHPQMGGIGGLRSHAIATHGTLAGVLDVIPKKRGWQPTREHAPWPRPPYRRPRERPSWGLLTGFRRNHAYAISLS